MSTAEPSLPPPSDSGADMFRWAADLWPIRRSLTGNGVRETLAYLAALIPGLRIHEVASGTRVLDWIIPDEWNLNEAYVEGAAGQRLIDASDDFLHIMGYSEPFNGSVSRGELDQHLHSLPEQPDAIPYVTSYYSRTWAFCIRDRDRESLGPGPFHVRIDSTLEPGHLTYADLVIAGESAEEVLLSTYVCHPNLANNELSGPVVMAALVRWILAMERRRFSYRIVIAPETIGAITYLAHHLEHLRKVVIAGWVLTCIGDDRQYSYMPSRTGETLADRVSLQALRDRGPFVRYPFTDRGSDERQWCAPRVDLPVCSVMRTKYGAYPEYHTSLDQLGSVVTESGLEGGLSAIIDCIELLESNRYWRSTVIGEPQFARRGLRPHLSIRRSETSIYDISQVLAQCDGRSDIISLAESTGLPWRRVVECIDMLREHDLIEEVYRPEDAPPT